MIINEVIWKEKFVKKIESKYKVTTFEVEEILRGKMKVRRVTKGAVEGEDVYLALGQTTMQDGTFPYSLF